MVFLVKTTDLQFKKDIYGTQSSNPGKKQRSFK